MHPEYSRVRTTNNSAGRTAGIGRATSGPTRPLSSFHAHRLKLMPANQNHPPPRPLRHQSDPPFDRKSAQPHHRYDTRVEKQSEYSRVRTTNNSAGRTAGIGRATASIGSRELGMGAVGRILRCSMRCSRRAVLAAMCDLAPTAGGGRRQPDRGAPGAGWGEHEDLVKFME
jgi:hypothetical protein